MNLNEPLTIFEKSQKEQRAFSLPKDDDVWVHFEPHSDLRRQSAVPLPEVSELDLMRHFSKLAAKNVGIDTRFYPLGSCTMKYNPRMNESAAALPGFSRCHPLASDEDVQGCLQLIDELTHELCRICGMDGGTLLPNAGSQGEFVGLQMIRAYHRARGHSLKNEILIPDSAHGTNAASAALSGYKVITIPSNEEGFPDLQALKQALSERTAGMMLTNPSTLGLFVPTFHEMAELVHQVGGLLYYDGANLNPILNVIRPGDMGFDVMHLNLHKTFSTPHGGGGPGSGPVLCKSVLVPFLPFPKVVKEKEGYKSLVDDENSIGRIASFYGNFGIYLRAYLYIKFHGHFGLRRIAEISVLNANYLKTKLKKVFNEPFAKFCMHEFVLQADGYLDQGIRALDFAKRLLDYEVYAPTIYFPLIIKECMLIEPTESESKATLDRFVAIMKKIVQEVQENPVLVKTAPHTTPVGRLDEVMAAKNPILKILS